MYYFIMIKLSYFVFDLVMYRHIIILTLEFTTVRAIIMKLVLKHITLPEWRWRTSTTIRQTPMFTSG